VNCGGAPSTYGGGGVVVHQTPVVQCGGAPAPLNCAVLC